MFEKSAQFFDAIYSWKDYAVEAQRLKALLAERQQTMAHRTLLDVACVTGAHVPYLRGDFACEGLDLDAQMLALAHERFPDIPFHHGDMVAFELGRQFAVVTCLFSSIAYVKTPSRLEQAVATMARHGRPDGVLVIEPFVMQQEWEVGCPTATFVDQPDLKITRMSVSAREGMSRSSTSRTSRISWRHLRVLSTAVSATSWDSSQMRSTGARSWMRGWT